LYINLNKTPEPSQVLNQTEVTELSEEVKEFNRITEKISKGEELSDEEYEMINKKMKKKKPEEKMEDKNEEQSCSKEELTMLKGGQNETIMENQNQVDIVSNEKKELSFEELSMEELSAILEKVQKVIASKTPVVQEMAKSNNEEMEMLKKQVQELSAKLNKPVQKTARNSSEIKAQLTSPRHSEGVQELAEMLVGKYA
jgi:hypothetical protein